MMNFGGGGSGGGTSSSTTRSDIPEWAQPYGRSFLDAYMQQVMPGIQPGTVRSFSQEGGGMDQDPTSGIKPMPTDLTQQVAGFDPAQEAAMKNILALTGGEQSVANAGLNLAGNTMGGAYLNPATNPYLAATYDAAARPQIKNYAQAVQPGIMAAAQRSGQFGSSSMNELLGTSEDQLGQSLSDLGTKIYGGNYATERANQLNTLAGLPTTLAAGYYPQQAVMGVGAQRQEQQQQQYDTAYQNAVNKAEWPFNILSGFGGAIGQGTGGAGSSTTNVSSRPSSSGFLGTVICTELYRQGLMDEETYLADSEFGKSLPGEVIQGYHLWAVPLAKAMRRSRLLTKLIAPLAFEWAKEMKRIVTGKDEGSWIGARLLKYGVPICAVLGRKGLSYERA